MNYNKHLPPIFYRLENRRAVPCKDYGEWQQAFEDPANRHVAATHVGDITISTIFTAIDVAVLPGAPPELFETRVFGGGIDYLERCATWEQAEAQHAEAVAFVCAAGRTSSK
jgi:hypothetical protein